LQSATTAADAVVIPTRAGGVEFSRVLVTLEMIPARTPRGVLICAARLGTNDLEEAIAWWNGEQVPIWGVIPERVGIAAGPDARLYREGSRNMTRFCGACCEEDAESSGLDGEHRPPAGPNHVTGT